MLFFVILEGLGKDDVIPCVNEDGYIHRYDVAVGEFRVPAFYVQNGLMPNPK